MSSEATSLQVTSAPESTQATRGLNKWTVIKLSITIVLGVFVVWQAGLVDALQTLRETDWRLVALAAGSALVAMVLNVRRWQMMLQGQAVAAPLLSLTRLYLIGMFFNNVLPSRFGGDVVRAYGVSAMATSKTRSVAAVLMDRLVGAISVLMLGVLAVTTNPAVIPGRLGELLVVGLVASILILSLLLYRDERLAPLRGRLIEGSNISVFGFKLRTKVEAAVDAVRSYSRARGLVARALFVSMVANGLSIVNLFLYARAVGADVSLGEVAVIAPIILAVGLLPLSINGIGTIELTFVLLFGAMGVDSYVALAIALLRRLVLLGISLVGGLLYAFRRFA